MTTAQKFWWLAPALSALAFGAVVWFQWGQHKVRSIRMKHPFRAYLTIAPEARDSLSHEVHVPPNREVLIQLRRYPRFHFTEFELVFGFEGKNGSKPDILNVVNTFIQRGKRREETPESTDTNYVDLHGNYHIKETVERTHPNCYALGFRVKTNAPGRYPVLLEAITDAGEGKPTQPLFVTVEDR